MLDVHASIDSPKPGRTLFLEESKISRNCRIHIAAGRMVVAESREQGRRDNNPTKMSRRT